MERVGVTDVVVDIVWSMCGTPARAPHTIGPV